MSGWQRLWTVISVLAGLYVMFYLSDAYLHPAASVKGLYDSEIARLEDTLKQVNTGKGSEQAVKQAEEAIATSKASYVNLVKDLPRVAIMSFFASALASLVAGAGVFLAGMAVEWVYRGFRPLPVDPITEVHTAELNTPDPEQQVRPALPNPDNLGNP